MGEEAAVKDGRGIRLGGAERVGEGRGRAAGRGDGEVGEGGGRAVVRFRNIGRVVEELENRAARNGVAGARLLCAKVEEGRVESVRGEDGLDGDLFWRVATTREVLVEGVPESLRGRWNVVRRCVRVKLVQTELDHVVDNLRRKRSAKILKSGGR